MKHLFLSPHLDDAAISCGDYIDNLVRTGHAVTVMTVFTGSAERLSMLARIIHKKFRLRDEEVMDVRLQEDRSACTLLGADTIHLGLPECLYRFDEKGGPTYRKLNELFETDPSREPAASKEIISSLGDIDFTQYDLIYIPLGVGRHIDHLLVREAVELVASTSFPLSKLMYYRDLPYLDYGTDPNWRSELAKGMEEVCIMLPSLSLRKKLAAIERYRSQLRMLWPSRFRMLRQIAAQARSFKDVHIHIEGKYGFPLYIRTQRAVITVNH
ncbi:LmbE family N-acetylglucosaminyl deacetylase [Paenibacillus endophyticus]|uniref:LmbE family N-acetylglucosaminyl deacetylase n=1 Tax=Paenibacillus endophyticus TaxID=1294268 RepID=A0A7W5CBS2_9BACL|nr:PIG-L family deacetylase [Paenibacillus endophyticus]MBB3153889.1 LmbE family N-acetylglucosaminyl deacetylase [Paenibacillus endophyticus]